MQSLLKSYDRTLRWKELAAPIPEDGADYERFVAALMEAWSRAPADAAFVDVHAAESEALLASQALAAQQQAWSLARGVCAGTKVADECSLPPAKPVGDGQKLSKVCEDAVLVHVSTFARALLTWVVDPTCTNVEAFLRPFLHFHRLAHSPHAAADVGAVAECGQGLEKVSLSNDAQLLDSRQAALLLCVFHHVGDATTDGKAPPYNRGAPTRLYEWLQHDAAKGPFAAHEIRLGMLQREASQRGAAGGALGTEVIGADGSKSALSEAIHVPRLAAPSTASRCCPKHHGVTVVKATEAHLSSQMLDGRPMYRCCNAGLDEVKQAVHGDKHSRGDECDDGEVFICPERSCAFAVCGRCLRREVGKLDVYVRVPVATLLHSLRTMSPPLTATLTVAVLEALLFPVTQIPLLVLTCSPTLSCWLGGCYSTWSAEFVVSFCLSLVLLSIRVAVGVWLCVELRRRQVLCSAALFPKHAEGETLPRSVRSERWEYFVNQCDRSLLRSMYIGMELPYVAWAPANKLVFDVVLVLAVCLSPTDSVTQKCVVGVIYVARGTLLSLTNPNILLALDLLAKAVVVHQLLALGLSSTHLGIVVDDGPGGNVVMGVMFGVTALFACLVVAVVARVLVRPFLTALWNESMAALARRDAQVSLLPQDVASLRRKLTTLQETLRRKQLLCTSLWVVARTGNIGSLLRSECALLLPLPLRGGTQVAVTAAMVLQVSRQLQSADQSLSESDVDFVKAADLATRDWLKHTTKLGYFHDADDGAFSLSQRQLHEYESCALGDFLQQALLPEDALRCLPLTSNSNGTPQALPKVRPADDDERCATIELLRATRKDNAPEGAMTHCNQLQLLAAAGLADKLDFSRCNLRGCKLPRGTIVRSSDMSGSDLSFVSMPGSSFVCSNLKHARWATKAFCSSTATLSIAQPIQFFAFSHDGGRIVADHADGLVRVFDAVTMSEVLMVRHSTVQHSTIVNGVAFSVDGSRLISGGDDKTAKVWDANTGSRLVVLEHASSVWCVAFSPDGKLAACGCFDMSVRVWDAVMGAELRVLAGHESMIRSVVFSPDGSSILSGSFDKTLRLWDASSGAQLRVLTGHSEPIYSACFSYDGKRVVSGSGDMTTRVWDASSGSVIGVHRLPSRVFAAALSPDGARLVIGSEDQMLRILDATTGAELRVITGHNIKLAFFSPDGLRLATSDGMSLRMLDVSAVTGDRLCAPTAGHAQAVTCVAFSPDGRQIVSGSADMTVRLWDAVTGAQLRALFGHDGSVACAVFLSDGQHVASCGDTTIRIWDASSGALVRVLSGHVGDVTSVAAARDTIASGSRDMTVRLWQASTGVERLVLNGHTAAVLAVACAYGTCADTDGSDDRLRIASGGEDKSIRIWDGSSGAVLYVVVESMDRILSVAFSPRGDCVLAGLAYAEDGDGSLVLLDPSTGARLRCLGMNVDAVSGAFSPDGEHIASATESTVTLFHAGSCASLRSFVGHTGAVSAVAFSPDGTRIASGGIDKSVRVWSTGKGAELHLLVGHHRTIIWCVAFDPSSANRIAAGGSDGSIRLWDVEQATATRTLTGHENKVAGIAYSSDGSKLVSGGSDKTVRIWDISTGRELGVFRGHARPVLCVAYSPNGAFVASGSLDATVRLWDATSGATLHTLSGLSEHSSFFGGRGDVSSVAVSPDSAKIAIGGDLLKIFNAYDGSEVTLPALLPNLGKVTDVAFSMDGLFVSCFARYLVNILDVNTGAIVRTFGRLNSGPRHVSYGARVACVSDAAVEVWDSVSGVIVSLLLGHARNIRAIAYSADGTRLITAGGDQTIRVWDVGANTQATVVDHLPIAAVELMEGGAEFSSMPKNNTFLVENATAKLKLVPFSHLCIGEPIQCCLQDVAL